VFVGVDRAISAPGNNIHIFKIKKMAKIRKGVPLLFCSLVALEYQTFLLFKSYNYKQPLPIITGLLIILKTENLQRSMI
jgi:hypothetical protein